ncbi:MAG: Na+/H+ antiporter subunit E [Actinomycetota bacterium]
MTFLRSLQRSIWALIWLTFVWVALWRDVSPGNLVAGLLVASGIILVFPLPKSTMGIDLNPLAMVKFLLVFAASVVRANFIVAWEVLTPRNHIREGIIGVPLRTNHPVVVTTINHAINLAPGTMVIDIDDDPSEPFVVYVHVLHLDDPADVHDEVRRLEDLILAAFGIGTEEVAA